MDLLSHGMYGATFCSRTGVAGGCVGGGGWRRDPRLWLAFGIGLMPDVVSLGPPFFAYWLSGVEGNYFREVGDAQLATYRWLHSLVVAVPVLLALRWWRPALVLPALAWPLHVLMDAVTHDDGKFGTMLLYPLSTWSFPGVRWWEHPRLVLGYWLALPLIWLGLFLWRRSCRSRPPVAP